MPAPDTLSERLRAARPPGAFAHVCVAFSGGLDSSVLLHLLAREARVGGFRLSALHVHHGLSPHADAWAAHCGSVCAALGVPLQVVHVRPRHDTGKGLEAAARQARHEVLARSDADWIALAHHADDQAETLLMRLVRGTGVAGAAAMRAHDLTRRLWRPLLGARRAELLGWAQAEGLSWIEDESNADLHFQRNFMRHALLAPLDARFPAATRNLCRAAAHFAEAADLLDELAAEDARAFGLDGAESGAREFWRNLGAARQANLLRYWLRQRGELSPDELRLRQACARLSGPGALREPLGRLALCATRSRVWLEPAQASRPAEQVWRGEAALAWGDGALAFARDSAGGGLRLAPDSILQLRGRHGGERLRLDSARPTRSLKQLCQEHELPAWWRDALPMLWRGDELLWVGGLGPLAAHRSAPGEAAWRIRWRAPDGVWRG